MNKFGARVSVVSNIPPFVPTRLSLFSTAGDDAEDTCEDFEPLDTLRQFVRYVDHLIAVSLEVRPLGRLTGDWPRL